MYHWMEKSYRAKQVLVICVVTYMCKINLSAPDCHFHQAHRKDSLRDNCIHCMLHRHRSRKEM